MTTFHGFSVGQQVEFHCEWPFKISTGVIRAIEERPRDFGTGTELGAIVDWAESYGEAPHTSFVPFWNRRLTARST